MIPAAKPLIGDEERAAVDRVLRQRHDRAGPRGRRLRERVRRAARRRPARASPSTPAPPALHLACWPPASARATRSSSRPSPSPRPPTRSPSPARPRSSSTSSPTTSASTRPPSRPRSPTRTAGIMPVHLYGHPAAMDRAAGASPTSTACSSSRTPPRRTRAAVARHARSAPSATFAMFSLYPTKNMTSGEGGMVVTARRRDWPARCACCATRAWSSATRTRSSASTPG